MVLKLFLRLLAEAVSRVHVSIVCAEDGTSGDQQNLQHPAHTHWQVDLPM